MTEKRPLLSFYHPAGKPPREGATIFTFRPSGPFLRSRKYDGRKCGRN